MRRLVGNLPRLLPSQSRWTLHPRLLAVSCRCGQVERVPFAGAPQKWGVAQQIRKYAPAAVADSDDCWSCKAKTERRHRMICVSCGHLQDVDATVDFFALLDVPKSFSLEPQELTQRFRHLQTLVHPDKFSNKTSREQSNSADWSSLINKAYKTLSAPMERGLYMLRQHGVDIPEDNSSLDKEFLMEMMERNEEVEEADTQEELERLSERLALDLQQKVEELGGRFEAQSLEEAKAVLVQMKYLLSIQNSIRDKVQRLLRL